jgi:hypothetical protein
MREVLRSGRDVDCPWGSVTSDYSTKYFEPLVE